MSTTIAIIVISTVTCNKGKSRFKVFSWLTKEPGDLTNLYIRHVFKTSVYGILYWRIIAATVNQIVHESSCRVKYLYTSVRLILLNIKN